MDNSVVMAALGRPFNLGMLYDCRQDSLVPGITLWDMEELHNDMRETAQPNSAFEIISSESISEKSSSLGVEASLKASFLFGLVQVEGSAKYLNDTKTSKQQARVTLQYKTTTHFKELTMNHLGQGNMKHQYVFDKGLATHVVTAILYGAHAFFVFDRHVSEQENLQDIQGNLKVMIKKIPMFSIEGEGSLKMKDQEIEKVSKLSCKFHGDFLLDESPVTFEDAVRVNKKLPGLLGPKGEQAVPVKVWLLPLSALDSTAAKLVRQISVRLIQEAQRALEDFSELKMRCNDVLKSRTVQQFQQIINHMKRFMSFCYEFELGFQRSLATKLPAIRGGGEDEAELAEILKKRASSPFNSTSLNQWLDCREREVSMLESIMQLMPNTQLLPSQNHMYKETGRVRNALLFVFTALDSSDQFLSDLQKHLEGSASGRSSQDPEMDKWYLSKDLHKAMIQKARLFSNFAKANQGKDDIRFFAVGLTDRKFKGSTIYCFEDGLLVSDDYVPPSEPEALTVDKFCHSSVRLQFSTPPLGTHNITGYRVEVCEKGQDQQKQQHAAAAGQVTVAGLSPNTEYILMVRAVTAVGVSPSAEVSIKTAPCSPPRDPKATAESTQLSLRWKKPAEMGPNVTVLKYMVKYRRTEKKVRWEQVESVGESVTISNLQPQTSYTIRVLCDCGPHGKSKKSPKVIVSTRASRSPTEDIKQSCEKVSSEEPEVYQLPLRETHIFKYGEKRDNKIILLYGVFGCEDVINTMMNYICGVKWNDIHRFKLTNYETNVKVFEINPQEGFEVDYSLSIIPLPASKTLSSRFSSLFYEIIGLFFLCKPFSHIHAVCSAQSSVSEDVDYEVRYDLEQVEGILKKLTITPTVLLTGPESPGSDSSETKDGNPIYSFDTSAVFAPNLSVSGDGGSTEMCWNKNNAEMKRFFEDLKHAEPKSLAVSEEEEQEYRCLYMARA